MPSFKKWLRRFRPPLLVSVFGTAIFGTLSILHVATGLFLHAPAFVGYLFYSCSAVFLSLFLWATVLLLKRMRPKQLFLETAGRHAWTARLTQDYAYRTLTAARLSLLFGLLLTLSKLLAGWYYASTWLMVLAGYYIMLCLSKFLLIRYERVQSKLADEQAVRFHEWKAYRLCGILLLVLTLFLQGVVIMIVKDGRGFVYNEIVVIAIAAYDFCCLANAMVYMIVKRKNHSPLVTAIKSISLASSLVAMLSLQTAMFAAYSTEGDRGAQQLMNVLTGTVVCLLLLVLGVFMIIRANKQLRHEKREERT